MPTRSARSPGAPGATCATARSAPRREVGGLDPRTVEAVEGHDFPALKQLRWRNDALDLSSLEDLLESLDAEPPAPCLLRTRNALDHVSLKVLARRPSVRGHAASAAGVRLLWAVCQIPDFRKTLTDAHLDLLETIFVHLAERGRLPIDWVADQVVRLERTDGDIDTLITRLAHIRTWTYVAYRADWLGDAIHWQERTRAVEDALSDALHDRLTQRFIDRRTQALLKGLHGDGQLAVIDDDGAIVVDGQAVGRVEGLCYTIQPTGVDIERRVLATAAKRAAGPELRRRAKALLAATDDSFQLDDLGRILWQEGGAAAAPVGQLRPGASALAPRLELLAADSLHGQTRGALSQRLGQWLDGHLAELMMPLRRLQAADLEAPGRGVAFLLVEGLGNVRARTAEPLIGSLGPSDRARLTKLGVRFGVHHIYSTRCCKTLRWRCVPDCRAIHHRESRRSSARRPLRRPGGSGAGRAAVEAIGFERSAALLAPHRHGRASGGPACAPGPRRAVRFGSELLRLAGLGGAELCRWSKRSAMSGMPRIASPAQGRPPGALAGRHRTQPATPFAALRGSA